MGDWRVASYQPGPIGNPDDDRLRQLPYFVKRLFLRNFEMSVSGTGAGVASAGGGASTFTSGFTSAAL